MCSLSVVRSQVTLTTLDPISSGIVEVYNDHIWLSGVKPIQTVGRGRVYRLQQCNVRIPLGYIISYHFILYIIILLYHFISYIISFNISYHISHHIISYIIMNLSASGSSAHHLLLLIYLFISPFYWAYSSSPFILGALRHTCSKSLINVVGLLVRRSISSSFLHQVFPA